MPSPTARVAVITPTTGKLDLLERCLRSVRSQNLAGEAQHLVVGDGLDPAAAEAVGALCASLGARFVNDARPRRTRYGPARASLARNLGWVLSAAPYVAHLDEDNTIEPDHLSSLSDLLDRDPGVQIAHSWRRILDEDGRPCGLRRYPWVIYDREVLAKEVFRRLAEEGVFTEGSEIIRDRMDAISPDLCHVDSSELMMRREVFDVARFQEEYSAREMIYQYTEDFLFCRAAQAAGLRFACTGRVTLNYFLGGYHSGPAGVLER
jgi:glycosyltransferase involved in cell wall biosynthesis